MYAPELTIEQIQNKLLNRMAVNQDGCWVWQHAKSKSGYGYWAEGLHKPMWRIHRLMWGITHNESMPRTKQATEVIDHICNNKLCFRPSHLQKISQRENVRRSDKRINSFKGCGCDLASINQIKHYKTSNYGQYYLCKQCGLHVRVSVVDELKAKEINARGL